ncbi:MAG: hypothetical protein QM619_10880 [Micropruina sp.]|uniref:hypothetical protein n=1 Tax=Micropruina sp. TaxID=2737536 RepID=UPI0039E4CD15
MGAHRLAEQQVLELSEPAVHRLHGLEAAVDQGVQQPVHQCAAVAEQSAALPAFDHLVQIDRGPTGHPDGDQAAGITNAEIRPMAITGNPWALSTRLAA